MSRLALAASSGRLLEFELADMGGDDGREGVDI